ncbi:MAG: hypothetical protein IJP63_03170 [Acholeplasmatales bacterium]|nr:hypothetical protein [Acholeplasmatales bacterium]
MNKKILITFLIINLIFVIAAFLTFSLMKFSYSGFRITLLIIGSCAVINLISISILEYKFKEYKAKKFSLILHSTVGVLAVAGIYILNYTENYDDYKLVYIFSILGSIAFVIVLFTVLNFIIKEKPKKVYANKTLNK